MPDPALVYNMRGVAPPTPNPNQSPDPKRDLGTPSSKASGSGGLNTLVQAERLLQIAFVLPAALLIGWGGGALLDRWLHQHWIYIVGLIFGAIAGMVEVVRQALHAGGKHP
jgi:ATP synthase protein I